MMIMIMMIIARTIIIMMMMMIRKVAVRWAFGKILMRIKQLNTMH